MVSPLEHSLAFVFSAYRDQSWFDKCFLEYIGYIFAHFRALDNLSDLKVIQILVAGTCHSP